MMQTLVILFWFGGLFPAYQWARANGHNIFMSVLNAVVWPSEIGWYIAHIVCEEDKG